MSFQGHNDKAWPGLDEIATRAAISERGAKRATALLTALGWLRKQRRGRGWTNEYECLWPTHEGPESGLSSTLLRGQKLSHEGPESGIMRGRNPAHILKYQENNRKKSELPHGQEHQKEFLPWEELWGKIGGKIP